MAGREPEWLEEFTSNGIWKVSDKVGADEVTLERQFGNEKQVDSLRLSGSIKTNLLRTGSS